MAIQQMQTSSEDHCWEAISLKSTPKETEGQIEDLDKASAATLRDLGR